MEIICIMNIYLWMHKSSNHYQCGAKNVAKMCISDKDYYVGVTVPPTICAYCNMKSEVCVYVPKPSGKRDEPNTRKLIQLIIRDYVVYVVTYTCN